MKQKHVKNHYVPECYLKRWITPQRKVFVYRTMVKHANVPIWKEYSISAIAYHKHLYTQIISGLESYSVEDWLDREFESPANEVLDKATSECRLTKFDWEILIKFLAAQDVRTPKKLLEHLQLMQKKLPEVLCNILVGLTEKQNSGFIEDLKLTKNGYQEPFPLNINTHSLIGDDANILEVETYAGRASWIHSIKHTLEKTRKILHDHQWTIVKPAKGYYWPTSDNPVVKLNSYSQDNYDLGGGWGLKKGNIFFPIGPEHAMFVQIGDKPIPKNTRLPESLTKQLIKFVVENSHRNIFSHYENNEIQTLRKRVVDKERLEVERKKLNEWHQINSEMERQYISSNKRK